MILSTPVTRETAILLVNEGAALGNHLGHGLLQLGPFLDEILDLLVELSEVPGTEAQLDDGDEDPAGAVSVTAGPGLFLQAQQNLHGRVKFPLGSQSLGLRYLLVTSLARKRIK